jgi:hypothetical protein
MNSRTNEIINKSISPPHLPNASPSFFPISVSLAAAQFCEQQNDAGSDFIILSPQTLVLSPFLYLLALYHKPAPLISPGLTFNFLRRAIAGK